jgi:hypothetical protein
MHNSFFEADAREAGDLVGQVSSGFCTVVVYLFELLCSWYVVSYFPLLLFMKLMWFLHHGHTFILFGICILFRALCGL